MGGDTERRWPLIEAIIRPVLEQVQIVVTTVFGIVTGIIDAVIQLLGGDFAGAWRAIEGVVATAINGVQQTLQNALALIGGLVKAFFSVGVDLVQGLINGIKSMAGALLSAIHSTITDAMPGFVQNALGIQSPSRVFAGIRPEHGPPDSRTGSPRQRASRRTLPHTWWTEWRIELPIPTMITAPM